MHLAAQSSRSDAPPPHPVLRTSSSTGLEIGRAREKDPTRGVRSQQDAGNQTPAYFTPANRNDHANQTQYRQRQTNPDKTAIEAHFTQCSIQLPIQCVLKKR